MSQSYCDYWLLMIKQSNVLSISAKVYDLRSYYDQLENKIALDECGLAWYKIFLPIQNICLDG